MSKVVITPPGRLSLPHWQELWGAREVFLRFGQRDVLLRYLSSLAVADTLGETAKQKIEAEMIKRMADELGGKQPIKRLFFTEFMVQ